MMTRRKRKAVAQPSEEEEGLELSSPSSEIVGIPLSPSSTLGMMTRRKCKAIAQPSEEEEGLELSSPSSEIAETSNDDTSSKLSVDISIDQKVKSKPSTTTTVRKKTRGRKPASTKKAKQNNGSSSSPSIKGEIQQAEEVKPDEEVEFQGRFVGEPILMEEGEVQQAEVKPEEEDEVDFQGRFVGEPIPMEEACKRWPKRYEQEEKKKGSRASTSKQNYDEEEGKLKARCHYMQVEIDDIIYNLHDDVSVQGAEGVDYIGKILEFFETNDNDAYFTAQWYYRVEDTVIKNRADQSEKKRVFISTVKDDNPLCCILSKLKIIKVDPDIDLEAKKASILFCDYYYDMSYSLSYTTFASINRGASNGVVGIKYEKKSPKSEYALLDLYSGCGAMSTGLCLGASVSNVNLITRWAVDVNEFACQSLRLNHPETKVINETAEDFLSLLKEWMKLCGKFSLLGTKTKNLKTDKSQPIKAEENRHVSKSSKREFEVENLIDICYGDPNKVKKPGLYFKVQWKDYGPEEDTWEPYDGLSNCQEKIQDFVIRGYNSRLLPLPGDVDVVCGGPPCQGISGHNRHRNMVNPLQDAQNRQLIVFMDIVKYLKPKFVLMENVVDILKLAGGDLGRYALSRLVSMNYQARIGMVTAGCYGLPQFRMRVFLWGAHPNEMLPQYPLPTHNVIVRGNIPNEFERCTVAYDEGQPRNLEKYLLLEDAISDLPPVENDEDRDEMPYQKAPQTKFQKFIRLSQNELMGSPLAQDLSLRPVLCDHRPYKLNDDDYERVCQIPRKKHANFRDLRGVVINGNIAELDKSKERVLLSSGKPLVPNYAIRFKGGKSLKPFGRLWWDETVSTVVTRPEPHNQIILHPEQDRVLSIRENARLQGFPDYYRLCGPVKERYIQVGNAVAVPVGRALGYCLGLACRGVCSDEPLLILPPKFSLPHSPKMTTDGSGSVGSLH